MDGGIGRVTAPTKQGQITNEIIVTEKTLERLVKNVAELESTLNPILRQSQTGENPPPEKEVEVCPVAQKIRNFNQIIDSSCRVINSIRERIEI